MENNIYTNLAGYTPYNGPDINLKSLQVERTAAAALSTSKSMDVQLVTAEGDKVSISMDARAAALYGVSERAEIDENSISFQKTRLSVSLYEREMTFTVEGDLSDAEMRDIGKVLKTLDRMMNHMVHGNLNPVSAEVDKLQGLATVSSMEAQMSYQRTVLVAQQTKADAVADPVGVTGPSPVQSLKTTTPLGLDMAEKADTVADAMVQKLQSSETPVERMLSFLNQLLDDYRHRTDEFGPKASAMIDRVTQRLRDALDQNYDR